MILCLHEKATTLRVKRAATSVLFEIFTMKMGSKIIFETFSWQKAILNCL
jgi:hypothetical protein